MPPIQRKVIDRRTDAQLNADLESRMNVRGPPRVVFTLDCNPIGIARIVLEIAPPTRE